VFRNREYVQEEGAETKNRFQRVKVSQRVANKVSRRPKTKDARLIERGRTRSLMEGIGNNSSNDEGERRVNWKCEWNYVGSRFSNGGAVATLLPSTSAA
jgi:hypothetical protein